MKKAKTYFILFLMAAALIPWASTNACANSANSAVKSATISIKTTGTQTGTKWRDLYFNNLLQRIANLKNNTATIGKNLIKPAAATPVLAVNTGTKIIQNDLAAMEKKLFGMANDYRVKNGLKALVWNDKIAETARQHSANMASKISPFGHNGFYDRFNTLRTNIRITTMAENVAYNYGSSDPAATALKGWLASSGHLKNITGSYAISGMGIAKDASGRYYFTQIFAK